MLAERGGTSGLLQFAILNIIISNPGNVFCALEISGSGRIKSCLDQSATADQSGQNVAENSEVVLEHCNREVAMHIEIKNSGTEMEPPKLVLISNLFDEAVNTDVKLLHPFVLRIRLNDHLWIYPFKHIASVNNKPYEAVYLHEDAKIMHAQCNQDGITQTLCMDESRPDWNQPGFCCQSESNNQSSTVHHHTADEEEKKTRHGVHCMKFDPLWYSINSIGDEMFQQSLNLGMYLQSEAFEETSVWTAITDKGDMELKTRTGSVKAANKMAFVTYKQMSLDKDNAPLNGTYDYLLIPEPITMANPKEVHEQIQGGPGEYLVLPKESVATSGEECGKIGVKYAGFINQNERCQQPRHSCLAHQPFDFWSEDKKVTEPSERKYFLSSRGTLADHAVSWPHEGIPEKSIQFLFNGTIVSNLHIEVNADKLTVLHPGSHGVLIETSSWSRANGTVILAHVHNRGLVSEWFRMRLQSCTNLHTKDTLRKLKVAPHQSEIAEFALDALEEGAGKITCIVGLLNHNEKLIAFREITIKKYDRCYCVGMCLCKCITDGNYACDTMTQVAYHRAGFRSQLPEVPRPLVMPEAALTLEIIFIITFSMFFVGIIKALIGRYISVSVGQFGLNLFQDPSVSGPQGRQMTLLKEVILNIFFVIYIFVSPFHVALHCARNISSKEKAKLLGETPREPVPSKFRGLFRALGKITSAFKRRQREKERICKSDSTASTSEKNQMGEFSGAGNQTTRNTLDRSAAIQQFRRQKMFLKQLARHIPGGSNLLDTIPTNPAESLAFGADEPLAILSILTQEQKSFIERVTSGGVKIYLTFNKPDIHLRRPGNKFSLCGHVRQADSTFKFTLGPHLYQVYEMAGDKVRKLPTPLPINPKFFQRTLNMTEMLTLVKEEPEYPCLNLRKTTKLKKIFWFLKSL